MAVVPLGQQLPGLRVTWWIGWFDSRLCDGTV